MTGPVATKLEGRHQVLEIVFEQQHGAARAQPCPDRAERRERLKALKRQLCRYQNLLVEAIASDYGGRAAGESLLIDVMGPVLQINHALRNLRCWMKPSRRTTELLFLSNVLQVTYQPKGVVGIIVPWNFPVYLALGPLVTALAAGNRAMIKMAPDCLATAAVLRRMLGEVFDQDLVAVISGDHPQALEFADLPFDHLVFTGSPQTGRRIMASAAANLTPVTLELGGKSPAIVSRSYPLADAARRITHGKVFNSGQACVAPDYALVPAEMLDDFVAATQAAFLAMVPQIAGNDDYTALINDREERRFLELLEDAKHKGATITRCGPPGCGHRHPLHLITDVTTAMRIASEEIFGPILPVYGYTDIYEAIEIVNSGPRPLALYLFGHDRTERVRVLAATHSGGVTLNDWAWHVVNHDSPFGGIGNSGMGSYHGVEGFRELSHARTVFKRHRFFPIGLFYPPYGSWVQRLAMWLFIGSGDPELATAISSDDQSPST
jgi:coniferyl-aldehyde dehydrogenase